SLFVPLSCVLYYSVALRVLLSFPTRRSSDLSFYENISHQTDAAPYSVHYTEAAVDHEPVLYLHWHHEMEFLVLVQGEITVHMEEDRKSTRLNSSHVSISYAVFCLEQQTTLPD